MEKEDAIIQAMMELSAQLKELKSDMTTGFAEVRADIAKLDDKIETVDAKVDVLSQSLIRTQADVLRLKRA
ncbi:hypothetical protein QWT69_04485 [Sporosarcina oncorhynchi]|uniref:Uncharacterized protein n=1 Tax=Sporosarcina oncorhynchi TaxID=3056444 RepID=A0ABZ0L753_9BACL|nr:hypothetical protein [Sporosarcina sp. T2O-4]WOV88386.1 hypothetical protein QWT69_04485 [Sporosarcina sp. T2O-4]